MKVQFDYLISGKKLLDGKLTKGFPKLFISGATQERLIADLTEGAIITNLRSYIELELGDKVIDSDTDSEVILVDKEESQVVVRTKLGLSVHPRRKLLE